MPKATKVVDAQSIASGGTNITEKLPTVHPTSYLTISQVGANVTDAATLAEILAGFGTIELTVDGLGTIIQWDADDLLYFNRDVIPGAYPFIANVLAGTADNAIRELTLVLPLSPLNNKNGGLYDGRFGLPKNVGATIKVSAGTDTAAGMDARYMTIQAIGPDTGNPTHIMGSFLDSFTAVATHNFQKCNDAKAEGLLGAWLFATTGREDLTSTDAPGVKNIGYAYGKSLQEAFFADALLGLRQNIYAWPVRHTHAEVCTLGNNTAVLSAASAAAVSDYYFADFGMTHGGVPFKSDTRVDVEAGVAEAMRLYPLVAHRVA